MTFHSHHTATDLAQHLRIKGELEAMIAGGYDTGRERHHELLLSLLMTASDLADQAKDWTTSKNIAVSLTTVPKVTHVEVFIHST